MSCMFLGIQVNRYCHFVMIWRAVSVLASIISYGLIKTLAIIEIPPHSFVELNHSLLTCSNSPTAWAELRPEVFVLLQLWLLERRQELATTVTSPTLSGSIRHDNLWMRIWTDKMLSYSGVYWAARLSPVCFQRSLHPDWSLSFAGGLYKGHCLCIFH